MKLLNYLNESNIEKIIDTFSNLPSGSPESIAKYILNAFHVTGIKAEGGSMTYLSGPMTNLPDDNWPTFMMAEKQIGGNVFNPAKPHGYIIKKPKGTFTWSDFMIEDVYNLLKCNTVVVLPGWSKSTGAITEVKIGEVLLNTQPETLKGNVGNRKYTSFIEDVKAQYYKDGNNHGYDTVIEPMLISSTEAEAAKYVRSYKPTSSMNEGVIDSIRDVVASVRKYSVLKVLEIVGVILDKAYSKTIVR